MKTKESTIKLLEKKEGFAAAVITEGIFKNVLGKYEWGIFDNGLGVRWYAIRKIDTRTFVHVYEDNEEMIEYIKGNIM